MLTNSAYNVVDNLQARAKYDLINEILEDAQRYMKGSQLMELNKTLNDKFQRYEVYVDKEIDLHLNYDEENKDILRMYIENKTLEGLSPRTIEYYKKEVARFLKWVDKPLSDVNTQDVRDFIMYIKKTTGCSSVSLDNIRRVLSSFFNAITAEGFIHTNPMLRIKKIKSAKKVKKPYTDLEVEKMREIINKMPENTKPRKYFKIRDLALFELLLSSGIRVAECESLNKNDIDINERSFVVLGKGNKERVCYFSVKCAYYLEKLMNFKLTGKMKKYEDSKALFVGRVKKDDEYRLSKNGIERRIREIGKECDVDAHPHKFRRTFATNLVNKGVPLEQVKELMGHSNMDTTLIYAMVDQDQVRHNHSKFAG